MIKKSLWKTAAALALAALVGPSWAALEAVDPGPYTAATGFFPLWYRDAGTPVTTLDLCLSKAVSSRAPGTPAAPGFMCTLLPAPGIFDFNQPIVFPTNWPDESFWFLGETLLDLGGGNQLVYVSGIEAAFGGGNPAPNDQVSFSRIRIRVDIAVPGNYKVTHPYGVETFNNVPAGRRTINMTRDIGIGAPGVFTGALAGDVGPFLRSVNGPYTEINPETGQPEIYVGDPNLSEPVTGSPNGTNFVRIQQVDAAGNPIAGGLDAQTDLFVVSGRIWNNVTPASLAVDRSSYKRTAAGATTVEVFATSAPDVSVCFRETVDLVPGTPPSPCQFNMVGDGSGKFFAQDPAPTVLPPTVIVTAAANTLAQTTLSSTVVDVVKITRAEYFKSTGLLRIEASSSDELVVPSLNALGLGGLAPGATGVVQTFATTLLEPPAFVTVVSSRGGRDTEPVAVKAAPAANNAPVANPIAVTTAEDTAVTVNVLTSATDPDGDVLSLTAVANAVNGTVVISGNNAVFTPALNFNGTASFDYTVSDGTAAASSTVTVTVTPANDPPVANAIAVTTAEDTAVTVDVLAGATDPDGDPLTLTAVGNAVNGTVVISGNSAVFTPSPNFSGTASFTYTVSDGTAAATGAVTVTVTPANDPPTINSTPVTTGTVGQQYAYDVNASDPEGGTLTYALTTGPTGMTINAQTGLILWTPTAAQAGANAVTVTVTDNGVPALSVTQPFTVTVAAAPAPLVDLDIQGFQVTASVRRPGTVTINLNVRNGGTVNDPAGRNATVVGTRNGVEVYRATRLVNDVAGGGATANRFPDYAVAAGSATGPIAWEATIQDDNVDLDRATATTNVR